MRDPPLLPSPKRLVLSIELPGLTAAREVEEHNRAVRRRGSDRVCYRKSCARCDAEGQLQPHDVRPRGLRLIVSHRVLCMTVWLARWRCRKCCHVFTDYPDFRTPLQALRRSAPASSLCQLCGARPADLS
jgi:hypothetical protein